MRGEPFLYAARLGSGDAIVLLRSARNQSDDWQPVPRRARDRRPRRRRCSPPSSPSCSPGPWRGPSRRVAEASRRLAEGESPDPLPVEGSTELRQLSTAFNELSEELHRAQDAERAFLLSVSHELKTPLTAIRGHAEAPRRRRRLARARRRGDRARGAPARAADPRPARPRPPAPPLVRRHADGRPTSARSRARPLARHTPQAHALRRRPRCVRVEPPAGAIADAGRALQALSNLVENAIRSHAGGRHGARSSPRRGGSPSSTTAPGSRPTTSSARSSASTSGTATAPTGPSAPGSGSRSSRSSPTAMGGRVDGREHARARVDVRARAAARAGARIARAYARLTQR